ncbi:MAG: CDGSH iron-sulfur domain-containing protein [Gammaproteobacteria bacterium]
MSNPVCAQKSPYTVELDAGDYWWCSCGKSTKQPFCDGSHKGGDFSPVKFSIAEKKMVSLCGCKQTVDQPFCDGSHSKLP